ncbi:thiol reductant ABC exporter subunit CydD [Salinibacterium sp. SYSU T00001]|uniref:thiol reductant ABC exporter subunit CydD n=1 Tax=Homoserinimonas sedimenticola TaxID=2986805 RepID=UPI0022359E12|nr:thiol reductant ABC exporter subunit CydD [Salinibacterium sedimenticola]MCW4384389.1 thiol reductant ABC exporter subunit CydD [Salinibacterium sedimenticola]
MSLLPLPTLALLGLTGALNALALVGMASALAAGITALVEGWDDAGHALAWGLASAALRAGVAWVQRVVATRALLETKERLRRELAERLVRRGGARIGADSTLATRGLDGLDSYITVFLPALVNAACVPLLVGARILSADWVSALIIVLTVPLIPVFMALIGLHTEERVAAAAAALERLSQHVVELARGLPVLLGLGRATEQARALQRISEEFRGRAMQTLRTAFLSSLALELIATISVAIVAVFIGVRLVHGVMPLELGLLALLLAPECFTPFRAVGSAFHASQDGKEALGRARAAIEQPDAASPLSLGDVVSAQGLTVRYAERETPAVSRLDFTAPEGGITVLDGPSGAGKTTVLRLLAGRLPEGEHGAVVEGLVTLVDRERVAWLPQHPHALADSVREELELYSEGVPTGEDHIRRVLRRLQLESLALADPARLSPGELRRVAFARVLLRVEAGARLVLLDEPTAHLDTSSTHAVLAAIEEMRGRATVLVASHDPAVRALADATVVLGAGPTPRGELVTSGDMVDPASGQGEASVDLAFDDPTGAGAELLRFLRPVAGRIALALLLGTLAALFAISLTAVSAWLIVQSSRQPHIMTLLVAIVGVRFFGIGRAVLRYAERLVGHDAVFSALTSLRVRLWKGLAAHGLKSRSALHGGNALDRLVRDADVVRDLALRAVLPPLVGAMTVAAGAAGLTVVHPGALPVLLCLAAVLLVVAPTAGLLADRFAARAEQELRSTVLRRFTAMLTAADDLAANGVDARARESLATADAAASAAARRGAGSLGLGEALVIAACSIAALAMLPLSADAVTSGRLDAALVAVLALTPLGLIEPGLDLVSGVRQWPALRLVLRRVGALTAGESPEGAPPLREAGRVTELSLSGVSACWPGARRPAFECVDASVGAGGWLVVTGPSGAGKSTLLSLLLGHLSPASGHYRLNGTDAAAPESRGLLSRIAWCPQEGYLFDSTLRGNLLIARPRAAAPSDEEMVSALERVGLAPLLASLPDGLDTRVGSDGPALSGGQRQRVAVARTLLAASDVILLDEPTAHLDEAAGESLVRDLRRGLSDRIVVLVTHAPSLIAPGDVRVELSGAAERIPELAVSSISVGGAA